MGDRGNIVISDPPYGAVVLYTHWRGDQIGQIAKSVLARRDRWNDSSYLARIMLDEMTGRADETTGFGISAWPNIQDNEHELIVLDCAAQRIVRVPEGFFPTASAPAITEDQGMSFEAYVIDGVSMLNRGTRARLAEGKA